MKTRAATRARLGHLATALPIELWAEILSHLSGMDLGRTLCSCRQFHSLSAWAWKAACQRQWPRWAAVADAPHTHWRRQHELLTLRDKELAAVPSLQNFAKVQSVVTARHRTVLTEWLAEVSFDFSLESSVVYKAIAYLDHYLASKPVAVLNRFQLVGIACLRAAIGDTRTRFPIRLDHEDKDLDPSRFAYISDRAYTAQEVEECTTSIQKSTPGSVRLAPNAKMFLRSFWYRAVMENILSQEEMHVYTVASFFLQLSLLDLQCSVLTPSASAAAALSLALGFFGKEAWPSALQHYAAYTFDDLSDARARLQDAQSRLPAEHLREAWRRHNENNGYTAYKEEWSRALLLVACPCTCV